MKRALVFSSRNFKETLRDPLSWVFCAGMPVFMMLLFKFILANVISGMEVPAGMTLDQVYQIAVDHGTPDFRANSITPGITIFSFTFIMLFAALNVSKDRCSSLLSRLYTSPMKTSDYIVGYSIPFFITGLLQIVICYALGLIFGMDVSFGNVLLSWLVSLPACFTMIGFGLLFGSFMSDKAAPGACSAIITLAGVASGAWFDISMNKTIDVVCHIMPFANAVDAARAALNGNYDDILKPLIIVIVYAIVLNVLSAVIFAKKMHSEK